MKTKPTYRFQPQTMQRKHRLEYGTTNFIRRFTGWKDRPMNEQVLIRMSSRIHSAVCHGTNNSAIRWKNANIRFQARYPKRSSCQYANTFSAHRFL